MLIKGPMSKMTCATFSCSEVIDWDIDLVKHCNSNLQVQFDGEVGVDNGYQSYVSGLHVSLLKTSWLPR